MTTPHRRLDTLRREIANQVAKRLNRRPRPSLLRVPLARIAGRIPTSTSFPSGHAASAAAFASAVALEIPALRVPLATLAGLVGFSRVATGAHYPSDVAAGFVLGATVASIGGRLVPPADAPGRLHPRRPLVPAEPRPTGGGLTLVVNPASHSGKGHDVLIRVQRDLPDISVRTHRRRRRGAGDAARGGGGRGAGGGRPRRHRGGCGRDRPGRRHSIGGLSRRHLQPFRQGARPRPRGSRDPSRPQGHGDQDGRRPRQRQAVSQHRERGRLQRLRGPPPTARRFVEQSW